MSISSIKSPMLAEINWIYSLILQAIKPIDKEAIVKPPVLPPELAYAKFLKENNVTSYERIILGLAHCFQLTPKLFAKLQNEEQQNEISIDSFGLIINSTTNLVQPTLHTANWLCDVCYIETAFIDDHHFLFTDQILSPLVYYPSMFNSPLIFTKKAQHLFFGDIEYLPEYSKEFPAQLLKTTLDKEDVIVSRTIANEINELITEIKQAGVFEKDKHLKKWIRPGFRALFYGPPGTGKTLTATIIGKETAHPVYRIDLSSLISKYIGETQKNLAKIFDRGEHNNWILFFDECDAILGNRSNTGTANERGANQEIAYLLQRIESYKGVVLLATNLKENIDEAFLRRFEMSIQFSMPDATTRITLWSTIFSGDYSIPNDWIHKLALTYKLTGGALINVLRFIAVSKGNGINEITLPLILEGIRREYHKMGQTMPSLRE